MSGYTCPLPPAAGLTPAGVDRGGRRGRRPVTPQAWRREELDTVREEVKSLANTEEGVSWTSRTGKGVFTLAN